MFTDVITGKPFDLKEFVRKQEEAYNSFSITKLTPDSSFQDLCKRIDEEMDFNDEELTNENARWVLICFTFVVERTKEENNPPISQEITKVLNESEKNGTPVTLKQAEDFWNALTINQKTLIVENLNSRDFWI